MRYDTTIFFQRVIQGEYDTSTGNYADPIIEETKKDASVNKDAPDHLWGAPPRYFDDSATESL